jgi:hypothetical protein
VYARVCIRALSLAAVVAGCLGANSAAALADVPISGTNCDLIPGAPTRYTQVDPPGWHGFGAVSCKSGWDDLEVKACMQQLLTGGWQTMQWTCETGKDKNSDVVSTYTAKVPYLTKGREYRTWVWGDINGHTNTTESPGVRGNGT